MTLLTLVLLVIPTSLLAFRQEPQVRQLINEASYERAVRLVRGVIAREKLSLDDRTNAQWLLGVALISLGHNEEAEDAFVAMLEASPDFFPSNDTAPKIMDAFFRARVQHKTLRAASSSSDCHIKSALAENDRIAITLVAHREIVPVINEIVIYFRTIEQEHFRNVTIKPEGFIDDTITIDFPFPVRASILFYYVDIIGRFGAPFISIGSPLAPLVIDASIKPIRELPPPPTSALSQLKAGWPIILGAVIALSGTLVYGLLKLNH